MTEKELLEVKNAIDNEGFDYTFVNYSSFKDIKDKSFHVHRKAFLESRKVFVKYLNEECKKVGVELHDYNF
jgi:hypothetical protein